MEANCEKAMTTTNLAETFSGVGGSYSWLAGTNDDADEAGQYMDTEYLILMQLLAKLVMYVSRRWCMYSRLLEI